MKLLAVTAALALLGLASPATAQTADQTAAFARMKAVVEATPRIWVNNAKLDRTTYEVGGSGCQTTITSTFITKTGRPPQVRKRVIDFANVERFYFDPPWMAVKFKGEVDPWSGRRNETDLDVADEGDYRKIAEAMNALRLACGGKPNEFFDDY